MEPGEDVFGESDAAIAEYVAAPEGVIAKMPAGLSFEQAAAIPLAANTALVCLRAGQVEAGQSILINGASGGVGTFAIQLAKSMGVQLTAVCSARNAELARSLGADVVVDYRRDDFTKSGRQYDLVLDLVGNHSLRDLRRVLKPSGAIVLSGGGVPGQARFVGPLSMIIRAQLLARVSRIRLAMPLAKPSTQNLAELAALAESGSITPIVDKIFTFDNAAEAIRYLEVEHARAKVVIAFS